VLGEYEKATNNDAMMKVLKRFLSLNESAFGLLDVFGTVDDAADPFSRKIFPDSTLKISVDTMNGDILSTRRKEWTFSIQSARCTFSQLT
jgi:hypothetical protein